MLGTFRGTELRVSLSAEDEQEPVVDVEVAFDPGGPLMQLAELEAPEAVELAGVFLRLARIAQGAKDGIH